MTSFRTVPALRPFVAACLLAAAFAAPAMAAAKSDDDPVELTSLAGIFLAARVADETKDVTHGAEFYQQAYEADPNNAAWLERAVVLTTAEGDLKTALPMAKILVKKAPDSQIASFIVTADLLKQKKFAASIKTLQGNDQGALAALTATLLKAWALTGQGKTDEAIALVDSLEGESWYEPFKLIHAGLMADVAGNTEDSLARFAKAYEQDGNSVRVVEAYARELARAGDKDKAKEILQEYLDRAPRNPLAIDTMADIESGKPVTQAVNTPVEGAAEAFSGLGTALGQEGGFELSAVYLRLALYIDPDSGGGLAALSLGDILDSNGLGDQAIQVLEQIPAQSPFRPVGILRAAVVLAQQDRIDEAKTAFEEAIRKNPDDLAAYIAYGNMQRAKEKYEEAADIYSRAIEHLDEPARGNWTLFYFRGVAYERAKQWAKAEADFKEALELFPDQPLVLNYLGYSWVDQGVHLDEALGMIQKAVDLRPNDGFIVDSLGWAYYRLGRYEDAVEELERAVSLETADPVINDHLGDAYWKVGRKLEAQFQWRHARDLGAKLPELEVINRKIAAERLVESAPRITPTPEAEQDSSRTKAAKPISFSGPADQASGAR
ncbi:tetratricopeptide repeat protein [Afifella sp. YEN Y35]|uniref:tetratricopeptide repeat protein n=1 Tax=Afifella sp. YEN Y35 TaxID=3388337 RepID=UPI0039E0FEA8